MLWRLDQTLHLLENGMEREIMAIEEGEKKRIAPLDKKRIPKNKS